MDLPEAARWLRYALAWMPTDVWDDIKRDAEYPKVREALDNLDTLIEGAQSDGQDAPS